MTINIKIYLVIKAHVLINTLKQIYHLVGCPKIKNRNVQFNYLDVPGDDRAGNRSDTKSNEMTSM